MEKASVAGVKGAGVAMCPSAEDLGGRASKENL